MLEGIPMRQSAMALMIMALTLAPGICQATKDEPQAAGKFEPTGAPTEFRVMHAATGLQDGRVLVTGGWS